MLRINLCHFCSLTLSGAAGGGLMCGLPQDTKWAKALILCIHDGKWAALIFGPRVAPDSTDSCFTLDNTAESKVIV